MGWNPNGTEPIMLTFDPAGLTITQRDGDACVVCHKKWPRPRIKVGVLPDNTPVHACDDCAEALMPMPDNVPLPRRSRALS
ncbi:hypothetical protein N5079_27390 [Planotetraspora sp. A-T 1434]|uniref:hypothetical protein n=1 Tax=Planotetraspora sp. A-T 1434 TaxID=2979219 RepID=UPI0021C107E3|nr:hypothetical protein [Planotetraspora sp. A-T 1434]MCT9933941.1 hypothetical protein [Planotetraspora sp. A-T 1434]